MHTDEGQASNPLKVSSISNGTIKKVASFFIITVCSPFENGKEQTNKPCQGCPYIPDPEYIVFTFLNKQSERGAGGGLQVCLLSVMREQSWKDALGIMGMAWRSPGGRVLKTG